MCACEFCGRLGSDVAATPLWTNAKHILDHFGFTEGMHKACNMTLEGSFWKDLNLLLK